MRPRQYLLSGTLVALLVADALGQGLDPAIERLRRLAGRDLVAQPWSPAQAELISWAYAVQEWLHQSPNSPRAQLARGVMLECLASPVHGNGFLNDMLRREDQEQCAARGFSPDRLKPGLTVVLVLLRQYVCDRLSHGCAVRI